MTAQWDQESGVGRDASPRRPLCRGLIVVLLLLQVFCLAACTTKAKARAQAQKAFAAGHSQAMKEVQSQQPVVTVLGQVRNHTVPWQEGLTLAQALDAAVYTGFTDPRLIRLSRGEDSIQIPVRDLLRGTSNPPVEAGDLIELIR
jgi:hypothetical protein